MHLSPPELGHEASAALWYVVYGQIASDVLLQRATPSRRSASTSFSTPIRGSETASACGSGACKPVNRSCGNVADEKLPVKNIIRSCMHARCNGEQLAGSGTFGSAWKLRSRSTAATLHLSVASINDESANGSSPETWSGIAPCWSRSSATR